MNTTPVVRRSLSCMATLAGIACIAVAGQAIARDPAAAPESAVPPMPGSTAPESTVVSFADLDLSESAGAAALYARLKHAAREVCGPTHVSLRFDRSTAYRHCYRTALAGAVTAADAPMLTTLHQARIDRVTSTPKLALRQPRS